MEPKRGNKIVLPVVTFFRAGTPLPGPESGWRDEAVAWLDRLLIDWPEFQGHIRLLEDIYQATFDYPASLAELPRAQFGPRPPSGGRFPSVAPLDSERMVAVLDDGPSVLSDAEIAHLIVHPPSLAELFASIDESMPSYWIARLDAVGTETRTNEGVTPENLAAPDRPTAHGPPSPERVTLSSGSSDNPDVKSSHRDRWVLPSRPLALALAAALLIVSVIGWVVAGYITTAALDRASEAEKTLAELRGQSKKPPGVPPGLTPLIELHAGQLARPADWEEQWKRLVDPEELPRTNLNRLRAASGVEVKQVIDRMRADGLPDYEILTYLKWTFASPKNPSSKE